MQNFVAYYRVSTNKQGQFGLGMEAQQAAVRQYLEQHHGELVAEFSEVESGGKDDRPEMAKALRKCRLTGATLLIAKLDRLSRNRRFLLDLADSTTSFVCCDMPEANSLTVGLLACLADYERQLISERTKAALAAAKARGTVLGNPNILEIRNTDPTAANQARIAKSRERNAEMLEVIQEIHADAGESMGYRATARALNVAGYKTARGKAWNHISVSRVMAE